MTHVTNESSELLDIVDAHNNIIGQASRKEAHKNNLMHRAAHILIKYNNYIFLQLRAANKTQFPNLWDVSAAGHVIAGDSYQETAIKELQEELKITIDSSQFIDFGMLPASKDNGFEFIKLYYINFNAMPNITLAESEITTGAWFQTEHITTWLKRQPTAFAGCFNIIWQKFLEL